MQFVSHSRAVSAVAASTARTASLGCRPACSMPMSAAPSTGERRQPHQARTRGEVEHGAVEAVDQALPAREHAADHDDVEGQGLKSS